MVAGLVWRCCVARTRVTRAVWCLSARALRRLPLGLRVVAACREWFLKNVARNSPASISDFEIVSLGLQRLWGVSKNDQVKLRATFRGCGVGVWCLSARALRRLPLGLRVVAACREWFLKNVARNSPASISDFEIVSLGLQRLWGVSKNDQVKLRATLGEGAQRQFSSASSSEVVQQRDVADRSDADAPQELAAAEQVHRDGDARRHQRRPPALARRLRIVRERR